MGFYPSGTWVMGTHYHPYMHSVFGFKVFYEVFREYFGFKVFLKYSENTLVSKNTKLLNTLRCLDTINVVVYKLKYSPKLRFFKVLEKEAWPSFF
jgi:hypothetical protein